ncbi:MAG: GDSL-type esterase/lipase family protein [Candidatus Lernaella stagnicola]|nr:GDSL-type esterase/lipase family protein [Candidatus Lernaella stagnicola]
MKRRLLKISMAIAVLLVLLIAAEIGLRSIGVGYRALVQTPPARFSPQARVRLLAIGDSFTFGIGADGPASYPDQLQRLLDEEFGPGACEVINWGLPAQNSSEALLALSAAFESGMRPDFVLVAVGINNYWNWHLASAFLPGDEPLSRIHAALSGSRLWRLAAVALSGGPMAAGRLYAKNDESDRNSPWFANIRDTNPPWLSAWIASDLSGMRDVCLQHDARPVWINYHAPSPATFAAWSRFADDPDVLLVDARFDKPDPALLSADRWHPNAAGYARVAAVIAEALRGEITARRAGENR